MNRSKYLQDDGRETPAERAMYLGVTAQDVENARAAKASNSAIQFSVFDTSKEPPQRYDLYNEIGMGGFGTVYSASLAGTDKLPLAVKLFVNDRLKNTLTQISNIDGRPYRYDGKAVEREYLISKLISARIGHEFCENHGICASNRFYSMQHELGFLVFPLFEASTLWTYIVDVVYPKMDEYMGSKLLSGFEDMTLAEIARQLANKDYGVDYNSTAKRRQTSSSPQEPAPMESDRKMFLEFRAAMFDIQQLIMHLVLQITTTLGMLHTHLIFHRDFTPSNILVDKSTNNVRLIDFGLSCAIKRAVNDDNFDLVYKPYVKCAAEYKGTLTYRDPLSFYLFGLPNNDQDAISLNGRFDTYACGKIIQIICDLHNKSIFGQSLYPVVRLTEFMPAGLYELIVDMTGEQNYLADSIDAPTLSNDERTLRVVTYDARPTMVEVATRVLQIRRQLIDRINQSGDDVYELEQLEEADDDE